MKTTTTVSNKTFYTALIVGSLILIAIVAYALTHGEVSNLSNVSVG